MERTAIFIDGAYLDKMLEYGFGRARIDYARFVSELGNGRTMLRSYYYHCPPYISQEPTPEEIRRLESKERFFRALSNIPRFQVRLGKLVFRGNNENKRPIFIQKLVDVMLSVDMVQLSATKQINSVILVAGDNDFIPAIEATKKLGVLVSLVHGPPINFPTSHNEIWQIADERKEISQNLIEKVKI